MRRVCTSIGVVWILSAIISIPPLIGWNDWPDEFNDETPCKLSEEKSYLIYSSSGSFYIPLLIMTVVYFKIYQATQRRLKDRAKASAMANLSRGKNATIATNTTTANVTKISSNEDSSSSGSPKATTSFSHWRARCVKCCPGHGGHSNKLTGNRKSKNGRCNSNKVKEARIEIESASDGIDHSRNDVSSSDVYGLASRTDQQNGTTVAAAQSTTDQCTVEISRPEDDTNQTGSASKVLLESDLDCCHHNQISEFDEDEKVRRFSTISILIVICG